MLNNKQIAQIVKGFIANEYCVSIGDEPSGERTFNTEGSRAFDLQLKDKLGPFSMIVESAAIRVDVGLLKQKENDKEMITVRLGLVYTHPSGGSNGSTIADMWLTLSGNMIGHRKPGGDFIDPVSASSAAAA